MPAAALLRCAARNSGLSYLMRNKFRLYFVHGYLIAYLGLRGKRRFSFALTRLGGLRAKLTNLNRDVWKYISKEEKLVIG
jgi:hypothetical protein